MSKEIPGSIPAEIYFFLPIKRASFERFFRFHRIC